MCDRVASSLVRKNLAAGTVVIKLKTGDFRLITRHQRLTHPTQRADVMLEAASALIRQQADGRLFRLVGVGGADLVPADAADPPGLFDL